MSRVMRKILRDIVLVVVVAIALLILGVVGTSTTAWLGDIFETTTSTNLPAKR